MSKFARLAHDAYTRAAPWLGCGLSHATKEDAERAAIHRWQIQRQGSLSLNNQLEHILNPECPGSVEMRWKDVFCFELYNTAITGDDCSIFLASGTHLKICPSLQRHPERKIRRPLRLFARRIGEPCFHMAGRNSENHGHFLLHHLPRLIAAQDKLPEMRNPKILLGNRARRWQERYLSAVGVCSEDILRAGPGTTLLDRLFYAPQTWTDSALACPEGLNKLRSAFLAHSASNAPTTASQPPLFISRADAPDRKLLNEAEIAAEVERQWGACEVIELSRTDFAVQLQKFARAPLIVGALGQGFTNLLVSSGALCLILDTEVHWAESYFSQTFRDLAMLHGNMASRLFAGTPIQKREHWAYPLGKFRQELATATSFWKQHRSSSPDA